VSALAVLPEKGSDGDLLREMIGFMERRLMDDPLDRAMFKRRVMERTSISEV